MNLQTTKSFRNALQTYAERCLMLEKSATALLEEPAGLEDIIKSQTPATTAAAPKAQASTAGGGGGVQPVNIAPPAAPAAATTTGTAGTATGAAAAAPPAGGAAAPAKINLIVEPVASPKATKIQADRERIRLKHIRDVNNARVAMHQEEDKYQEHDNIYGTYQRKNADGTLGDTLMGESARQRHLMHAFRRLRTPADRAEQRAMAELVAGEDYPEYVKHQQAMQKYEQDKAKAEERSVLDILLGRQQQTQVQRASTNKEEKAVTPEVAERNQKLLTQINRLEKLMAKAEATAKQAGYLWSAPRGRSMVFDGVSMRVPDTGWLPNAWNRLTGTQVEESPEAARARRLHRIMTSPSFSQNQDATTLIEELIKQTKATQATS